MSIQDGGTLMKATIQKVIEDIAALTLPLNPEPVLQIFNAYSDFLISNTSEHIDEQLSQLIILQQLALEGTKKIEQINDLTLYEKDFAHYAERGIVLQEELNKLDTQYLAIKEDITLSRELLTKAYNELLAQTNNTPNLIKSCSPEETTQRQAEHIIAIRKTILEYLHRITLPSAKIQLHELKMKQAASLVEWQQFLITYQSNLIITSKDNLGLLQQLLHSLQKELKQCALINPKLNELHQLFSERLSLQDVNLKKQNLIHLQDQLTKEINSVTLELDQYSLSLTIKEQLTQEFQSSHNVDQLISAYKNKVDSFFTYVNLSSWLTWSENSERYNEHQLENNRAVEFLNLLMIQKQKQSERKTIAAQLEELSKISISSDCSGLEERQLIEETRILLNELPSSMIPQSFNSSDSAIDYFLLLIDTISFSSRKIEHHEQAVTIIEHLLSVGSQLAKLRKDYHLSESEDHLLPNLEELMQALPVERLLAPKQQLQLCEDYLNKLQIFIEQLPKRTKQAKTIEDTKKEVLFNIQILQIALEKKTELEKEYTLSEQIEKLTKELLALQQNMSEQYSLVLTTRNQHCSEANEADIDSLKEHELIVPPNESTSTNIEPSIASIVIPDSIEAQAKEISLSKESTIVQEKTPNIETILSIQTETQTQTKILKFENTTSSTEEEVILLTEDIIPEVVAINEDKINNDNSAPITPINPAELAQLHHWNGEINQLLSAHSAEINQWYKALFSSAVKAVQQPEYSYQYSQLIRDILFELQTKQSIEVLNAYVRICPNPAECCSALLALKPNYPVDDFSLNQNAIKLPKALVDIDVHSKKLKTKHPVEGKLLEQAMCSLYALYQNKTKNQLQVCEVPSFTLDPRYEPLKRHRGFLKVWELIEDFFRFIIGKIKGQADYEFSKRPCFFKTNSLKLIETALSSVDESEITASELL